MLNLVMKSLLLVALLGFVSTRALMPAVSYVRPVSSSSSSSSSAMHSKLTEIDEICIENVAEFCLKAGQAVENAGDCDIEEYEALVNQLQDQRRQLAEHVAYIDSLLERLNSGSPPAGSEDLYIPG
jgi:hypothetical protein